MKSRRSHWLLSAFTLPAVFLAASCERASNPPSEEENAKITDLGKQASDALMKSLGGQLKGALQSGGPVNALVICQQAAMPLTEAASGEFEGVRVSRTTLQPRNPANAPNEQDRAVLLRLAKQVEAGAAPPKPALEWHLDHAIFYRPLLIQEVCLNCHGDPDTFSPELKATLAEEYPEDQATGYSLGDFRGVIRVEMDRKLP